ncbi:MAG: GH92 family glycosyl hydrolase [Bacteroidetes bacterium]|nr:GH92 family glycosyl hydrolase [Bacteroidota bacterium]
MKYSFLLLLLPFFAGAQNPLPFVDPFIGTGGHGHTFPGATAPFGMVQLSPDTRTNMMDWDACSGYHNSDSLVYGFSHTHLSGTGVADYCDILLMPFTGGVRLEPEEYASPFKKSKEKAEAGFYSVMLERDRILCELTATERVGVHRYSYPLNQEKGSLVVDLRHRDEVLESQLTVVNDREIAGYRISKAWAQEQHVYFVARFSKPFFSSIVLDMAKNPREAAPTVNSKAVVGLFGFYNQETPLVVTVGISGTSIEGARRNLEAECPGFDFEKIKTETQEKWRRQLSKIEVEGGSKEQKTVFYTALYHAMIAPNLWNDVDGSYRGRDNQVHPNPGHDVYTVFSTWDTHRALHPLLNILEPKRTADFVKTFLRHYEQGGRLTVWELAANETDCMIGNHSIPVIADAYAKGIRNFDLPLAMKAMQATVSRNAPDLNAFRSKGLIEASDAPESVSKTLELAYDDWCIAQIARAAGDSALYSQHIHRAQFYKNLFDPGARFFRARKNGAWYKPFDPYEVNFNYTEANAWQYRFSAPQDVSGLIRLMGGAEAFEAQLDSLFTTKSVTSGRNQADITGLIGQYVQGNEPSHHIAYLYNYIGKPWKTQQRIRQILDTQYSARPDGLSGNEDCGQMSAWYVMSAVGIYSVLPGSDYYVIGTPLFEKVSLHLDNGQTFTLRAPGVSGLQPYIQSVRLNEKQHAASRIFHNDLVSGGELLFEMGLQPGAWATAVQDRPVSQIIDPDFVIAPFIAEGDATFRGHQRIALASADPDADLYYNLKGERSTEKKYKKPFDIKESVKMSFRAQKNSHTVYQSAAFIKIPERWSVLRYAHPYSPQYTAGGREGLIDGIRGGLDFRTGDWQGFEGVPLDVVIDLGKQQLVKHLNAHFLQDQNAWIFFPQTVRFEGSVDGVLFSPLAEIAGPPIQNDLLIQQKDFEASIPEARVRFIRVVGIPQGKCPEWHKGAGYSCWIFSDEIEID